MDRGAQTLRAVNRPAEQMLPVALKLASGASIEPISSDEPRMD